MHSVICITYNSTSTNDFYGYKEMELMKLSRVLEKCVCVRKPSQIFFFITKCLILHLFDLKLCDLTVNYPLYCKTALSSKASAGMCCAK